MSTDKAKTAEVPVVPIAGFIGHPDDPLVPDALVRQSDHLAAMEALRAEVSAYSSSMNRLHHVLNKHGLHPGRTDDNILDILDAALAAWDARIAEVERKLNTPELHNFAAGVVQEAAHQRERWGPSHDVGKEPQDWFWLLGYLGGKALKAHASGDTDKALHHCISSAAALANWHAAISGAYTDFRPGIDPVARGIEPTEQPSAIPVGGSLVHPDDAARAGAAIGPNFNPMR